MGGGEASEEGATTADWACIWLVRLGEEVVCCCCCWDEDAFADWFAITGVPELDDEAPAELADEPNLSGE